MKPEVLKNYLKENSISNLYEAEKRLGYCRQSLAKYLAGTAPIPKKLKLIICKN